VNFTAFRRALSLLEPPCGSRRPPGVSASHAAPRVSSRPMGKGLPLAGPTGKRSARRSARASTPGTRPAPRAPSGSRLGPGHPARRKEPRAHSEASFRETLNPKSGGVRVDRGGSSTASRSHIAPPTTFYDGGVRCASHQRTP